jgi:hypothetical protein
MSDELSRAIAAHARATAREGAVYQQPSASASGTEEIGGRRYVVLRNINGILRVYRVRPSDGVLRAMKRWPKELEEQ